MNKTEQGQPDIEEFDMTNAAKYLGRGGLLLTGLILSAAQHGMSEHSLNNAHLIGDSLQGAVYLKTAYELAQYAIAAYRNTNTQE